MSDAAAAPLKEPKTESLALPGLSREAVTLIEELAERAAALEKAGRKVDVLALFHDLLQADVALGIKVQRNSVLGDPPQRPSREECARVTLPREFEGALPSFTEVVRNRRSMRDYADTPVDLKVVARMLWLGFGLKSRVWAYGRAGAPTFHAPTGGGLQSTRVLLIAQNIDGLARGIYEYDPEEHVLTVISHGEIRWKLFELCAYQDWIAHAAGIVALTSDIRRVRWKYEERSYRLAHLDAGVIGENMHLAATALGLASCLVFGFVDEDMDRFLDLAGGSEEFSALLMTFGLPIPRYAVARRKTDGDPRKNDADG